MSNRLAFSIKTYGTFMGIKVNTTNKDFTKAMRISGFSRSRILNTLRPMFKKRLENRIPKLIEQLRNGVQGLPGTKVFESRSNEFGHRPHRDIPDPLSRIVQFGTSYKVVGKKDRLEVKIEPHKSRNANINFHNKMSKVPRISTVWSRLDETCLPFYTEGHHTDIYEYWLAWSRMGLYSVLYDFMNGIDTSGSEKL